MNNLRTYDLKISWVPRIQHSEKSYKKLISTFHKNILTLISVFFFHYLSKSWIYSSLISNVIDWCYGTILKINKDVKYFCSKRTILWKRKNYPFRHQNVCSYENKDNVSNETLESPHIKCLMFLPRSYHSFKMAISTSFWGNYCFLPSPNAALFHSSLLFQEVKIVQYPTAELPYTLKVPNQELLAAFLDPPKNHSTRGQTHTKGLHTPPYSPKIASWGMVSPAAVT